MKFLGQHIYDLISRFRNDVHLENISSGTIASGGNLGLDSNNKIVKANVPTTHDAVTLAGSLDYITLSGQEITRNAIDLTTDVSGTLPVSNGGLGNTSFTNNAVLIYQSGVGTTFVNRQFYFSEVSSNVHQFKIGDGSATGAIITTDNVAPLSISPGVAAGTNIAGGSLTLQGGVSTGNTAGGSIIFKSSSAGSSGSIGNAPQTIGTLDNEGNLQIDGTLTTSGTLALNTSGVIQVASQPNIDHDSLTNFVAAEHYRWDTDISSTATINAANIPTLNQNTTGTAAGLSATLAVGSGGTGATTFTSNAILTGNGTSAIQAEAGLTYDSEVLNIGDDDDGIAQIKRLQHTDDVGGDLYVRGGDATGTDKAGGQLQLFGGRATGSGAGGGVIIQAGETNASSGTTLRGANTIASFRSDGDTLLTGNLIFEGPTPDVNETTFSITDPTADRTITVPDASGTMAFLDSDITGQAATVATIAGLAPNTATTAAAQPNITSLGTLTGLTIGGDLTVNGDTVTFESANADDPHVLIKNTNNGTNEGARLDFNKLRADDGTETGQNLGEIHFTGQDSAQNTQTYGFIIGEIDVGTSGQESGQIVMGVANHDGDQATGFKLTGGSQNDEIDAEVGFGTSSVTTVAGDLTVTSNATINGGNLTVTSGTSGDATLIIEADTDNNNENDLPRLWFKADTITEGAIQLQNNTLDIINNVSSSNGIRFLTGTTDNTGTTDPSTGATERMFIASGGTVTVAGALQPNTIELGHASDTTIARSAAGTVTIEGKTIATTNKTVAFFNSQFFNSGTSGFYAPFNYLFENSNLSTASYFSMISAPYDGRVLRVSSFTQGTSSKTTTVEMYLNGDDSDLTNDQVGTDLVISSYTQKNTGTCANDWVFSAGDALSFRITNSAAASGQVLTFVIEFDLDT